MEKVIIYYHKIDFDGKSAGALARSYYLYRGYEVTCIGINYGDEIDWSLIDKDTIVVMVDYTHTIAGEHPERKAWPMFKLNSLAKEFIWLDHHGTSIADVENYASHEEIHASGTFKGIRNTKFSGTELTWIYFFGCNWIEQNKYGGDYCEFDSYSIEYLTPTTKKYLERVPRIIYLLGRYDVWDKNCGEWEDALAFQYGLRLQGSLKPEDDESFVLWRTWIEDTQNFLPFEIRTIAQGQAILAYNAINNLDYVDRHGFPCVLYLPKESEFTFFAMNTGNKGSASFDSLQGKYDAFIAYQHDGTKWSVSIYSFDPEKCNAAVLCSALGGGGHPGAAGFVWPQDKPLPFSPISQ